MKKRKRFLTIAEKKKRLPKGEPIFIWYAPKSKKRRKMKKIFYL